MFRAVIVTTAILACLVAGLGIAVAVINQSAQAEASQGGVQIAQAPGTGGAESARPDRRGDAIDELLESVRVDEGLSYRGLTVFPVTLRREYSDFLPRTFDDAVESGDLIVKEVRGGEVNQAQVKNTGRRPVFIMAGEVMSGSKQDRTVQRDVLVPTHSAWIEIPVYCVEAGRWTVVTPQFGTRRSLASPGLRKQAYGGADQSVIWEEVDRTANVNAVPQSSAKAFQEVYDNKEVQDRLGEYMRGLRIPQNPRTVGFVVFRWGRPLGADLFGTPALYSELKDKLLKSYVLSVGTHAPRAVKAATAHDAAQFLARAWAGQCRRSRVPTPGIGEAFRLSSTAYATTGGGALIYQREAVHFSLFDDGGKTPVPVPIPGPVPIPRPDFQQQLR